MSILNNIASQLSAIVQRLNNYESNSKKIEELPEQIIINANSNIHVSELGISKRLKISQIASYALSLFQNNINDKLTTIGTITRSGNDFTFDGFSGIIGGSNVTMIIPETVTIEEAVDGFKRIDIAVLNAFGNIQVIAGLESETIAIQPPIPINTLQITSWDINGNIINDNSSIIFSDAVKKSFAKHFIFSETGTNLSIPLNPNGYSEIRLNNNDTTSIAGVDLSLINGNASAELPYEGKFYLLRNISSVDKIILHNSNAADIPFYTENQEDLILPAGKSLLFSYYNGACEILFTNFTSSSTIQTLDEVLEAGGYSERPATVGNFKAKEIQIGESFIPESSGALFRIQKNSDGTISIIFDSVSQTDSDNFGRLTSTFSNNDGVTFSHLENDNSQGAIARIRKDGVLFTLINSFLKVNKDGVYRDVLLSGLAEIADILDLQGALDNKADLVDGIVPQSQSQGSSLFLDPSTYVIQFVDARGNVQYIDLPIESLFKDANYDSSTKTLYLTLDNGSTIEVPLEDLVDLPEIQIEPINPAVLPSEGKKVWFNYNNGNIYLNVEDGWLFFGKAISDTSFDKFTASYDHSQKTNENPHETKLIQLKDYSSAAYSEIIDTDSFLILDSATSLWKRFSFNNLKSKLKTYFDTIYATSSSVASQISTALIGYATQSWVGTSLITFKTANYLDATSSIQTQLDSKANKGLNIKITSPSAWVTGTLSETEVLKVEIPPSSLSASDILKIKAALFDKIGTNGFLRVRIKLSTSATMPSGDTDLIGISPNIAQTNLATGISSDYYINGGNIIGHDFLSGKLLSEVNNNARLSSKAFNNTITNYLYFSVTLGNVNDQVRLAGVHISNN